MFISTKISILPESYCNLLGRTRPLGGRDNFNSPRVLLQRVRRGRRKDRREAFQFSQSLIATECRHALALLLERFQFSQSLIATEVTGRLHSDPTLISILPESYCNLPHPLRRGGSLQISILPESYCNSILIKSVKSAREISILPESYCNAYINDAVEHIAEISILPESYCNLTVTLDYQQSPISILPESYCNFVSSAFLLSKTPISILPESYCNDNSLHVTELVYCHFNSPRVLLQRDLQRQKRQIRRAFQFSQSLIATPPPCSSSRSRA